MLVLALVALLQATRFAAGWPVAINGVAIPTWASAVFALGAGVLALLVWREARR